MHLDDLVQFNIGQTGALHYQDAPLGPFVRRCGLRLAPGGKPDGQCGDQPGNTGNAVNEVDVRRIAARPDGVIAGNH